MKSHELFRSLLEDRSAKELAAALNLSASSIYKWTEPCVGGSGGANPLDRIEQLLEATNDDPRLLQWICARGNGFFVKNPASSTQVHEPGSVITAANRIVQEFAEMLSLVATAAHDNSVTQEEAVGIRERWQELKAATEEFVTCCEQGDFEVIRAGKPA